jgi:hypothetical protein
MKYVISGSRRIKDYSVVKTAIESAIKQFGIRPSLIIEGGQRTFDKWGSVVGGVDYFAMRWAGQHGIPFQTVKARWGKFGLAAGPIRNRKMADEGDVLVALPDIQSRGTRDMINVMRELEKPVFILESK